MGMSFTLIDLSPGHRRKCPNWLPLGMARNLLRPEPCQTVEWHIGRMEAELRQWGTRLDNLLAMAEVFGTAARIDYRKRLDESQGEV